MSSCSSCLCSFTFTGPARICDVTMSHTWIYSWCEKKAVFFHFFIYFCSFRSFRLFRSFRFGRFVSLFRVLVHVVWVPGYRGLEVSRRTISSLLPKPNGGPVRRIFFSQASPVLDCSFAAEKNACNTLPKQASLGDSPVRIL